MKWSLILDVARTHLTSRLRQTIVAALGVTFGIGAYIILMSFMTGLNGLLDGMILNRTPHVHLYNEVKKSEQMPIEQSDDFAQAFNIISSVKPQYSLKKVKNAQAILAYLNQHQKVKGVSTQVMVQGYFNAGATNLGAMVLGIDAPSEVAYYNFNDYIIEGDARDLEKAENGIIVGAGVVKKLSKHLGDVIQITNTQGTSFSMKIVAIYQSGLAEIDDRQGYVSINNAQNMMVGGTSYYTDINIKLHDMDYAPIMAQKMSEMFDVTAVDIFKANAQFDTGSDIRNLISYAVSITLLIVAGFGIYNILNMLIYEKMNDIAILKAVGFSGSDVQWMFISQALFIGVFGGILGLLMGYGVSVAIDNTPFETDALPTIKTFPVNFDPLYYIGGILFAIVSTFLAGYLPARKAKKIDPVEIIRGQ